MKKQIRNFATGAGAAGITITTAVATHTGSVCTGICSSCSFGCAPAAVGLLGAGYVFLSSKIGKNSTFPFSKRTSPKHPEPLVEGDSCRRISP
jgi:hypothetical protein